MDKRDEAARQGSGGDELKYETSDARFRPIFYFMVGLLVLVAVSFALMVWMFHSMEERAAAVDRPPSPLADPNALPPEPRLQADPQAEFEAYRQEAERLIRSYEWIDKEMGVVRIPVERAMELLADGAAAVPETAAAGQRQPDNN